MGATASVERAQEPCEIEEFLTELRLQFYIERVLLAGFDDVDSLKAVEARDLVAMGFAPTHAKRLLTKLGKRAVRPSPAVQDPKPSPPPLPMGAAASHSVEPAQEPCEIENFLKELSLQFYTERVVLAGFADLDSLKAVEGRDLVAMGFAPTHAKRLLTKLGKRAELPVPAVHAHPADAALPQDGAAALAKAMSEMPRRCSSEVVEFLTENGLGMYADAVLRSGFDDMEVLMLIEDEDMREIGLPRGHVLKLRKKLRELEASTPTDSSFAMSQLAGEVIDLSSASSSAGCKGDDSGAHHNVLMQAAAFGA